MYNIYELLKEKTNEELILLANEINMIFIPSDGACRTVASQVYGISPSETKILHIVGIAPALALELSKRLK